MRADERCRNSRAGLPGIRGALSVVVAGESVALFNIDGRLFALDDACILCGTSLAIGLIDGTSVLCAGCHWRYDVANGGVHGIPGLRSDTFEVAVVDAHVMVDAMPMPHAG